MTWQDCTKAATKERMDQKCMFPSLSLNNFNRSHIGLRIDSTGFKISLIYCSGTCVLCEKFKFKPLFSTAASRTAHTKSVPPSDFPLLPVVLKDALDALSTNGKCTKKSATALASLGNYKQVFCRT